MSDTTTADARPRVHRENRKKLLGRHVLDNQARAVAKFVRVPPRKARLVINEVRGKYAQDALAFLRFIPNRAAGFISKVVHSAVSNAANNHNLNADNLKLIQAFVDEGPRLKRMQPRAQGRAYRILKRTAHITIIVQEVAPKPRKPRKPTGTRAQAARDARAPRQSPATAAAAPAPQPTAVEPIVTAQAAATPEQTTAPQEETVPTTANTADTTDEIGAPIDTDAESQK